jgi:hypothetical protein
VVMSKPGEPVADLGPHQRSTVRIGGMKGEFVYDDKTFDDPDPDILRMFYGDDEDDLDTP